MNRLTDTGRLAGLRRTGALLLLTAMLGGLPVVFAQQTVLPVNGVLTDASQMPVEGFRVVLRIAGTSQIIVSPPTDDEGSFRVDIPTGTNCAPIAVVSPNGKRLALDGMTDTLVVPNTRFDIELSIKVKPPRDPRPFRGADRLFVSFVEDVTFVERLRAQSQVVAADFEDANSYVSEFLAAYNWRAVPTLEVGGRIGFAGTEFDSGSGATGATDLDLWGKLLVGSSLKSGLRWAPGAVLTLPTGDASTGLSTEAARLKLFGALRYDVGPVTLSGHVGVRVNGDSTVDGTDIDGQVAGTFGVAGLMPFGSSVVGVAEFYWEGARFDGGQDEGLFLVGANWKPLRAGFFRLASGFGLDDGSPDFTLIAGYVFDF
jgi:hypothetical protein